MSEPGALSKHSRDPPDALIARPWVRRKVKRGMAALATSADEAVSEAVSAFASANKVSELASPPTGKMRAFAGVLNTRRHAIPIGGG